MGKRTTAAAAGGKGGPNRSKGLTPVRALPSCSAICYVVLGKQGEADEDDNRGRVGGLGAGGLHAAGAGDGPGHGAASAQQPSEQESQAYIDRREHEWAALATTRNPQLLEQILADDYVGVSDDGTVRNKSQEIDYWAQLPLAASAEPPEMTYRHFGDTVLAHGDQTLTPRDGGAPVRILWTDVWMFRDGKWQVVGSQNATVPPKG